jgi:hypothetical protein
VVWRALKGEARGAKVTPELIDQVKIFDAAGKKLGEIAKEVGLHHFVVMRILKMDKAEKAA